MILKPFKKNRINEKKIKNSFILFSFFFVSSSICYILQTKRKPIEFTSDIYLPAIIPPPKCNCRSCKPLYQMHAIQMPLNQCRYQSRASPSPPPIPPQPNRGIRSIQYTKQLATFDAPLPPPRAYQLVPIRDTNQTISRQSPRLHSFGNSYDRNSLNRNNYENVRDLVKPPFVVKDPRRKPYYYNELSQSNDANETIESLRIQNAQAITTNDRTEPEHNLNDTTNRISGISVNSVNAYGSGGSLDHIF